MHLSISQSKKLKLILIIFVGLFSPIFADEAAASTLCDRADGTTLNASPRFEDSVSRGALPSEAGETYTFEVTAAPGITWEARYLEQDSGSITESGSGNGTVTITSPDGASRGYVTIFNSSSFQTGTDISAEISCDGAGPGGQPGQGGGSGSNNSTTKSAVVSSISRSQTSIIQQNIGARISAINSSNNTNSNSNSNGNSLFSMISNGSNSQTSRFGDVNDTRFDSDILRNTDHNSNSLGNVMRRLALNGNFDSSRGGLGSILAASPNSQTNHENEAVRKRNELSANSPFTIWGHGSYTNVENDLVSGSKDNRYDGDIWGYNLGLDYKWSETLTAGLSLGYHNSDVGTQYNNGQYDEDGWNLSSYAILKATQDLTIVGEFGYGFGDIDLSRNNGAITGETSSDSWYGSLAALHDFRPIADNPDFTLTPSVSLLAARKKISSYVESNNNRVASTTTNTMQVRADIEAAHGFYPTETLKVEPLVKAGIVYDFYDEINDDSTAFNLGGGLRIVESETGLSASLNGNYVAGRSNYNEYSFSGTIAKNIEIFTDSSANFGVISPYAGGDINEFGDQTIKAGFGYENRGLTTSLSLDHTLTATDKSDLGVSYYDSHYNYDTMSDKNESRLRLVVSMPL